MASAADRDQQAVTGPDRVLVHKREPPATRGAAEALLTAGAVPARRPDREQIDPIHAGRNDARLRAARESEREPRLRAGRRR